MTSCHPFEGLLWLLTYCQRSDKESLWCCRYQAMVTTGHMRLSRSVSALHRVCRKSLHRIFVEEHTSSCTSISYLPSNPCMWLWYLMEVGNTCSSSTFLQTLNGLLASIPGLLVVRGVARPFSVWGGGGGGWRWSAQRLPTKLNVPISTNLTL